MRKITVFGLGTAVLVAGALMFSFTLTPVTAAGDKIIVCHNDVDDEDVYESVVIEVGSENSADKHVANHVDHVDATLTPGDEFSDADCGTPL